MTTYMKIQQMRRPTADFYDVDIDKDCNLCLLPPLLLQTFVENSFKYGCDPAGKLYVSIKARRECVGISNVYERLKLFFKDRARMIAYNDEGAVIKIYIPMEKR